MNVSFSRCHSTPWVENGSSATMGSMLFGAGLLGNLLVLVLLARSGKFVQYCPGTWCFIQMVHEKRSLSVLGFSVLYSSLMALLVLATVLCNLGAMHNLYTMHLSLRRHPRCCPRDHTQPGSSQGLGSLHPLEELDHLLLLALMT
ncbi:hypothetical protein U0070_006501, partial [Myodes glareolus]